MTLEETIAGKLRDPAASSCRPIPFWSWNDKLEPDELRRQIGAMERAGMGGFSCTRAEDWKPGI